MKETASVWLMNGRGEFLLQLRSPRMSNNPNTWGNGAGGGIEDGETSLDAICRETKEELGLDIAKGDFAFLGDFFDLTVAGKEKHLWLYFARGDWELSDIKTQETEITAVKFVPLADIKKIIGTFACSIQPKKIELLENHLKKIGIKI